VFSLIMFTVVYALLLVLFIYMVNKKIKHGPYDELNEPVNFQTF
jgi:cytochrome d ubiquinol oxidase subunit I